MAAQTPIQAFKYAHEIGYHFWQIQEQFNDVGEIYYGAYVIRKDYFPGTSQAYTAADYYAQDFTGDLDKQYYIRFGRFLDFLTERIIPNINYDPTIKLIKIDTDYRNNIIHVSPKILSSDPKVCFISKEEKISTVGGDFTYLFGPYAQEFIIPFEPDIKGKYGYVMNIYFNMDWILTQIEELKDDKGIVSLFNLLDALCKGFNEATGHFNNLEAVIDTEENIIKIIDDVALPDRKAILKSPLVSGSLGDNLTEQVIFDTYRYQEGGEDSVYGEGVSHAGFIKELSFNTTVSPELATMITIGSTKQGYIKGADATALSRMNNGLVDRYKTKITNADEVEDVPPPPLETQYQAALDAYNAYIFNIGVLSSDTDDEPEYIEDVVEDYKQTQTQLIEYFQFQSTQEAQKTSKTAASPNSGFLPFDLSLTMNGLSGMKVYQSFLIDTDFLPTNYPSTLEFLIKGITHKIENNQWTTTIESMAIPKNPFASTGSTSVGVASAASGLTSFSTSRGGSYRIIEGVKYKNGEIPETKLREINNAAKYKGQLSSDRTNPSDPKTGRVRLYDKASLALDRLIVAAEAAGIKNIKINSAYRVFADQQRVYNTNCPGGVCKLPTATPGTSNHGFGLAVDFATPRLRRIEPGDELYDWLIVNGPTYGFKRIEKESWHWEYQI